MLILELYNALEVFRTVYGLVKTKSLKCFGGGRWRSERLSIDLGGDCCSWSNFRIYSEGRFLDLARWSYFLGNSGRQLIGLRTNGNKHLSRGLMMAVTAHLSLAGEQGCDEPHIEVSGPHMISHPVDFAQFLSAIPACPAETVLVLLHLLFSRELDRHHCGCNSELVASCATQASLGTACYLKLLVASTRLLSLVGDSWSFFWKCVALD